MACQSASADIRLADRPLAHGTGTIRRYSLGTMNKLIGLLSAASVMLGGCASSPPPVRSMRDAQANFNAFHTFGWRSDEDNTTYLLDKDIRAAITSELERKGYAATAPGVASDLVLHYETAAAEKAKSNPVRIGIGVGGAGSNGAAGVGVSSPSHKIVREGTLVLSAIDPNRKAEVWNGSVSREVASGGRPSVSLINSAVAELLKDFPSR
jgi:hypothetical protein